MYKIGVIGMGGLGVLFTEILNDAYGKEDVFVIAGPDRVEKYKKEGIYCNGRFCDFHYVTPQDLMNELHGNTGAAQMHTQALPDASRELDLIIVSTKYSGLYEAMDLIELCVGGNTQIISLLNGIASEEELISRFGEEHVLYCVAQKMDSGKHGNHVKYHHRGELLVGEKDGSDTPRLQRIREIFEGAGLPYRSPKDIYRLMWNKLMCNVGVNQVTMIYEGPYACIQESGEARNLVVEAMREVQGLAKAKGIQLTDDDISEWLNITDTMNPEGETSMRRDGRYHIPTEVELFAGTIIRIGKELGIPTPVNDDLYARIKAKEAEYLT